jgi:hypothetical protein
MRGCSAVSGYLSSRAERLIWRPSFSMAAATTDLQLPLNGADTTRSHRPVSAFTAGAVVGRIAATGLD